MERARKHKTTVLGVPLQNSSRRGVAFARLPESNPSFFLNQSAVSPEAQRNQHLRPVYSVEQVCTKSSGVWVAYLIIQTRLRSHVVQYQVHVELYS